jgi:hypothetical protein
MQRDAAEAARVARRQKRAARQSKRPQQPDVDYKQAARPEALFQEEQEERHRLRVEKGVLLMESHLQSILLTLIASVACSRDQDISESSKAFPGRAPATTCPRAHVILRSIWHMLQSLEFMMQD